MACFKVLGLWQHFSGGAEESHEKAHRTLGVLVKIRKRHFRNESEERYR